MSGRATRWGFHRLRDRWAKLVVDDAELRPGQLVVDLGAGHGALTLPMLDLGVRVLAVEKHPARADALRKRVVDRDATVLTLDLTSFHFPNRPVRTLANPPFALAAEILAALVAAPHLTAADLVLPRWLTLRHVESTRSHRGFHASEGIRLPREAFVPSAPLGCSVLRLRRVRPVREPGPRRRARRT